MHTLMRTYTGRNKKYASDEVLTAAIAISISQAATTLLSDQLTDHHAGTHDTPGQHAMQ